MTTFKQVDEAAAALDVNDPLYNQVNHIVAHAEDNGEGDDNLAMVSLEGLLCYEEDKDAVKFFTDMGVTF